MMYNQDENNGMQNETYREFGTGAKVWFGLCAVANILAGIGSFFAQIAVMINYGISFESFLSICLAVFGACVGAEYFVLLKDRKKIQFYIIAAMIAVEVVLNILIAAIGDLGFATIAVSVIGAAIHLGITYAVLSKYGGNVLSEISSTKNTTEQTETVTGSVCCPKCGGTHLQAVNESNTTGGGFSAGKGCCGYILLGPLGVLCGACGSKTRTTNKTFFVCMDCGNKFAK